MAPSSSFPRPYSPRSLQRGSTEEEAWSPSLQGYSGHHGRPRMCHWPSLRGAGPGIPDPPTMRRHVVLVYHQTEKELYQPQIYTPPVPAPLQWCCLKPSEQNQDL